MSSQGGVYVPDEPTTSLHLADVEQLLRLLDGRVDSGKSVVVIEHHQEVMAHVDCIIDLGPGAAHDGHAVLDSVRGMQRMRGDLVESPTVMEGYSGGAIATVWAAQEQPAYAPELRFGGAVAGGTPTDYALLYRSMNGALDSGLFAAAIIGQAREYPSIPEFFGDFAFYMSTLIKDLPQPALAAAGVARIDLDVLAAIPAPFDSDIAQSVIAANKPGATAPTMPTLLYHGSRGRIMGYQFIPEEGVTELVESWRANGRRWITCLFPAST